MLVHLRSGLTSMAVEMSPVMVDFESASSAQRASEMGPPVVLGNEIRDLGAAAGVRLIEHLGGAVSVDGERLLIRLPA